MPVVLLVRHGQASFGADDYDVLSDLGREQSAVVGAELSRRGLRSPVVVTGTLRRQQDTASLAVPDVAPSVDGRFDEYDSVRLLTTYPAPQVEDADLSSRGVQPLLDHALQSWLDDVDGTWPQFSHGALAAVHELTGSLEKGCDAVVFTSGGVIAAVAATLLGTGAGGVVALNRVAANGAITKLVAGRGGLSLVSFNDHAHFEGPRRGLLSYR